MMKRVICLVGENSVIHGDVVLYKQSAEFDYIYKSNGNNIKFIGDNFSITKPLRKHEKMTFKQYVLINLLWLWHMVLLRKEYVYLTGVLR